MFNCHSDKSNDGHESFMINDVQNMTFFVPSITTQKQRLPKMFYQHACFYRSVHHSIVQHIFVCGSCLWFCIPSPRRRLRLLFRLLLLLLLLSFSFSVSFSVSFSSSSSSPPPPPPPPGSTLTCGSEFGSLAAARFSTHLRQ